MAPQKVVKIPQSSWNRAEDLIPKLEGKTIMAAAGDPPTVAAVVRLALVLGLEQLEEEHSPEKSRG